MCAHHQSDLEKPRMKHLSAAAVRFLVPDDIQEKLERRLGRLHARQRLGIEMDHEAQVFGQGLNFFHIENLLFSHPLLEGVLRLSGLPPAPETPIVCKDAPCPPRPPPVFVSFTNGLKVESWDHGFSFKIGGRIFVDGGVSTQPVQAFADNLRFFPAHAAAGFSNQLGFRQALLQVEGTAFKDWEYKFQYDFVGSPNDLIVGGIRDAYVAWRYFEPVTFQVGNFFEPNSLERTNSSLYRDFIERALASDLLAGSRHIGLAAVTGGAAPGLVGKSNWSAKAGIFSTSLEDGAAVSPTNN